MIQTITVLGAGTMGQSIATLFAQHHYSVSLYETNVVRRQMIEEQFNARSLNVQICTDLNEAATKSDLVIESISEKLTLKRALYKELESIIKPEAIIASNTSTFALEQLAEDLLFANRFVITHFFNPAHVIPLVELIGLPHTQSHIMEKLTHLFRKVGKSPVVLKKDIPGFIANRLQAALLREACFLLNVGIADAEQIDTVVKEGIGLRWATKGPFEIADLGGLDIWSKVTGHLFPELNDTVHVPEAIQKKLNDGQLGFKTGKGFYEYNNEINSSAEWENSLLDLHKALQEQNKIKEDQQK